MKTPAYLLFSCLPAHAFRAAVRNSKWDVYKDEYSTLSAALYCSFDWSASPEGHSYWIEIINLVEPE